MAEIFTNKGERIICDDADLAMLSKHIWHLAHGYAQTRINRRTFNMHRMLTQPAAGFEVDHVNRDRADNRRSNLRICSRSQNASNKISKRSKSGFRGVHISTRGYADLRFYCMITVNGKVTRGKPTRIAEQAARQYDELAFKHFGHFAVLNFERPRA